MKKILFTIALLFLLVGCVEIDPNPTVRSPEIELTNVGELNQLYEETEELDDITFTLVLKYFQDNELTVEDLSITWYEGSQVVAEDTLTHFVEIKHTLHLNVRVVVQFRLKGENKELSAEAIISVTERPTQVTITNGVNEHAHQINAVLGTDEEPVTYTATLTNNLSHHSATWIIVNRDINMKEVNRVEHVMILSEEMNYVSSNEGTLSLTIDFEALGVGNYLIYLEVGKYQSNYQHYILSYGEVILFLDGEATQTEEFTSRELSVGPIADALGTGTLMWFVNNVHLDTLDNEYIIEHTEDELGGYLYHVEFHPDQAHLPVQKSDPLLVTNALPVETTAELRQAVADDVPAVVLTKDLLFTETLTIRHSFTLIGNNHKIESQGIDVVISVSQADNVYIKDLNMEVSNRYHLHYHLSKNGYVENVIFKQPGIMGGMTDLSAALYVHSSEVTIKDITILNADNTGIRIDSPTKDSVIEPSHLIILGYYEPGGVLFPVASGNSVTENVMVSAVGYVDFVLPLGMIDGSDSAIIRWSSESEAISWSLNTPNQTVYEVNDTVDVVGITIDVRLPGMEIQGDLGFVYMFLDMFPQHGTIEIMNLDQEVLLTYYIIDHNNNGKYDESEYEFGEDLLMYSSDSQGLELVRPTLVVEPGEYLIRVTVGGVMDLGNFKITVNDIDIEE
ncbi:MAG: hypothetical protein WC225_03500 [Acholeplasmataceae bacterium]|nr:hypothetical protein [Acholeplasmataceae bacterium]